MPRGDLHNFVAKGFPRLEWESHSRGYSAENAMSQSTPPSPRTTSQREISRLVGPSMSSQLSLSRSMVSASFIWIGGSSIASYCAESVSRHQPWFLRLALLRGGAHGASTSLFLEMATDQLREGEGDKHLQPHQNVAARSKIRHQLILTARHRSTRSAPNMVQVAKAESPA